MKITLIDSDSGRRKDFYEHLIVVVAALEKFEKFYIECFEHVWGNGPRPDQVDFIPPGELVFIHANDTGNPGWAKYLRDICHQSFGVCYSGDGVGGLNWHNDKHYPFSSSINSAADIKGKWRVRSFLDAIIKGDPKPFHKLVGHDACLEAKLKLLHCCLTPNGKANAREIYKQHFVHQAGECREEMGMSGPSPISGRATLSNAFSNIDRLMDKNADCLSQEYISALEELKTSLHLNIKI